MRERSTKIPCPHHECKKSIHSMDIKEIVDNELFQKYIKINFLKFLYSKYRQFRFCNSGYCFNVIERDNPQVLRKTCELCNSGIVFESKARKEDFVKEAKEAEKEDKEAEEEEEEIQEKKKTPLALNKGIEDSKILDEWEKPLLDSLPSLEQLNVNIETLFYDFCDSLSVIENPEDFNVRYISLIFLIV